jgi:hypothetical protein
MCVSEEASTPGQEVVVSGCLIANAMTTVWWSLRPVLGHACRSTQHLMGARPLHDTQIQPWWNSAEGLTEGEQRLHV